MSICSTSPSGGKSSGPVALDHPSLDRVLSTKELLALLGVSRATLWRLQRDGLFPKLSELSPNRKGLFESQYRAWRDARLAGVPLREEAANVAP